jgi:hypothetical protein
MLACFLPAWGTAIEEQHVDLADLGQGGHLDDGQWHCVTDAQCAAQDNDHSGYPVWATVAVPNECPSAMARTYRVR